MQLFTLMSSSGERASSHRQVFCSRMTSAAMFFSVLYNVILRISCSQKVKLYFSQDVPGACGRQDFRMDKRRGIKKGGNKWEKSQPSWVHKRYRSCLHTTFALRLCSPLYGTVCVLCGVDEKDSDAEEKDTSEAVIRKESLKVSTNEYLNTHASDTLIVLLGQGQGQSH